MSIWTRISEALAALANGEGLAAVFDRLRTPPERSIAFTIAIIGLGAKMAKADGEVTRDEVRAFRQIFFIPPQEEANAARVFNLARQDVAGYDAYARKIARMFAGDRETLMDIMEGLFRIAVADGDYHEAEDAFLRDVAGIFGLRECCFRGLRERHVPNLPHDPYDVLDVDHDAPLEEIRAAWRTAVKENHPDRIQARGVPPEAVRLAEQRLIAINAAWEEISQARAA
ncbi:DnaJ like chaperone protein [Gemmobacter megaterium]|uniref:DnaJ like chaperone protein n=1 Tax=Gemmobacter megaterium TaxID=1086013 RepID=A0A1N7LYN5_9RHOB|nr:molecular chaperone DjiA [Gemmobacter megaterium]GGE09877.1 molecular chaperone DjlA [Gemmobacter megaterium]SIS78934.1 DnaJ like chaperone protein [Gemmobacter megaterium]